MFYIWAPAANWSSHLSSIISSAAGRASPFNPVAWPEATIWRSLLWASKIFFLAFCEQWHKVKYLFLLLCCILQCCQCQMQVHDTLLRFSALLQTLPQVSWLTPQYLHWLFWSDRAQKVDFVEVQVVSFKAKIVSIPFWIYCALYNNLLKYTLSKIFEFYISHVTRLTRHG